MKEIDLSKYKLYGKYSILQVMVTVVILSLATTVILRII